MWKVELLSGIDDSRRFKMEGLFRRSDEGNQGENDTIELRGRHPPLKRLSGDSFVETSSIFSADLIDNGDSK